MPAPLAKGTVHLPVRIRAPRCLEEACIHHTRPCSSLVCLQRGTANLASGLIIATSIIIAAGIAVYENEQIREWIEMSRRRIAIAIQGLGNDGHSLSPEERERLNTETRHLEREENIRLTRLQLLRRAREEGVAVDLDALAAIGKEEEELQGLRSRSNTSRTFDDMVGTDGMLRGRDVTAGQATGVVGAESDGLRNRGARGFASGLAYANPFEDEANVFHDEDKELEEALRQSRETSHTLYADTPRPSSLKSDAELDAEIEEAIRRSLEDGLVAEPTSATSEHSPPLLIVDDTPEMVQTHPDPPTSVPSQPSMPGSVYESFYYGPHPNLESQAASFHSAQGSTTLRPPQIFLHDNEYEMPSPAGTLTPTEDGFSTAASIAGTASDVGILAELESALSEHESQRERDEDMMSESGASEAFSMVGASTPGDWTDVESNPDEDMHEIPPQAIGH